MKKQVIERPVGVEFETDELIDILETIMVTLKGEGLSTKQIGSWLGLFLARIIKQEHPDDQKS